MIRYHNIEIVYPPSPTNEATAAYLLERLKAYRIPPAVVQKTGIRDIAEVEKPTLIVLCMPESQHDPEVEEAILDYSTAGNYHRIIALITAGRSGERFPYALLHETLPDGTVVDREPLAANISAPTFREQKKKLEVEKLRILATILGVAYDDLRNRRRRQRMQIASAAGAAILIAALSFLGYALSRVRILSAQNDALNVQYDAAREAVEEAEAQRLEARKAFARTIASKAGDVLKDGDSELALLLELEMLTDDAGTKGDRELNAMKELPELQNALHDTLEVLCGEGYVPLTKAASFTRPGFDAPFAKPGEEDPELPYSLYPNIPEGIKSKEAYIKVSHQTQNDPAEADAAAGSLCGIYNGWFHDSEDDRSIYCSYIHFPDDPELDYFLRDLNEDSLCLEGALFLPDGTLIGQGYDDQLAYRVRVSDGAVLDFFDEKEDDVTGQPADDDAPVWTVSEAGGLQLPHAVTQFASFEGMDLVFGFSAEAVEVYSKEPFCYRETIEGISALREQKGMNYLFGSLRFHLPLLIYTKEPFAYLSTLEEDQWDREVGEYIDFYVVKLSDGREMLCYGGKFYDFGTGEEIWPIKEEELVDQWTRYGEDISSEGWIAMRIRDSLVVWDLADGSRKGSIPIAGVYSKSFYGAYDEATGLSSAQYYQSGSTVYKHREEAIKVPPDIEGQIRLAKELIGSRKLTDEERMTYHLEEIPAEGDK